MELQAGRRESRWLGQADSTGAAGTLNLGSHSRLAMVGPAVGSRQRRYSKATRLQTYQVSSNDCLASPTHKMHLHTIPRLASFLGNQISRLQGSREGWLLIIPDP